MIKVSSVAPGSAAEAAGVLPGDYVISVNGEELSDVLDYQFHTAEKKLELVVHRGPELLTLHAHKRRYDDLGIESDTFLMDKKRSCANKCVFCFIDQLPKGLRDTLYFKDDDSRLSFLQGSYITLTNLSEHDIDRIIRMRISPINISVHTTNPELRVRMMKNKNAGKCMDIMRRFADNGVIMNGQIVLCRGLNDGEELIRSMNELETFFPRMQSVSVVPSGLTCYREGLYPLIPFDRQSSLEALELIEKKHAECREKYGAGLFYPGDEFYLMAGRRLPDEDFYDGYPQLGNGVGMLTSTGDEFDFALEDLRQERFTPKARTVSMATGAAAFDFISGIARRLENEYPQLHINVYRIENNFFGKNITVAGLLTGADLLAQLKERPLGETLYIPAVSLRYEQDMFLDNITLSSLSDSLRVPIVPLDNDGGVIARTLVGCAEQSQRN